MGRLLPQRASCQEHLEGCDPGVRSTILAAGTRWDGNGSNTTRVARSVYEYCGVAMIMEEVRSYKEAFLFGCALSWGLEVPEITLSDKVADAAFSLSQVLGDNPQSPETEDTDEQELVLDLDNPATQLPEILDFIYNKVKAGERRLDVKDLLDSVPSYAGLPTKQGWEKTRPGEQKTRVWV